MVKKRLKSYGTFKACNVENSWLRCELCCLCCL